MTEYDHEIHSLQTQIGMLTAQLERVRAIRALDTRKPTLAEVLAQATEPLTTRECVTLTGGSLERVRTALMRAVAAGTARRIGRGSGTCWAARRSPLALVP